MDSSIWTVPFSEIKIESPYSPTYNHQLQPPQSLPSLYNTTSYYSDMPPADTLIFPKKLAPKAPYNIQPQVWLEQSGRVLSFSS